MASHCLTCQIKTPNTVLRPLVLHCPTTVKTLTPQLTAGPRVSSRVHHPTVTPSCKHVSRRSSQPKDQSQVSCIAGRFFTIWTSSKAPSSELVWTNSCGKVRFQEIKINTNSLDVCVWNRHVTSTAFYWSKQSHIRGWGDKLYLLMQRPTKSHIAKAHRYRE